jgi:hypothetical protein
MKKSVYIETSVVSYLTSRGSRDLLIAARQEETRELWIRLTSDFDSFVSSLVFAESESGDAEAAKRRLDAIKPFPVLQISPEAEALARHLVEVGAIPVESSEDAMHIALAALNGIDVIVTWNFAHINNPFKRLLIRRVVEQQGYVCPEICSPGDLLEVEE